MKTQLMILNFINEIRKQMEDDAREFASEISKHKVATMLVAMMLLSFETYADALGIVSSINKYSTPLFIVISGFILLLVVKKKGEIIMKGLSGDQEAWKKLGSVLGWLVAWFFVTPFVYRMVFGLISNANSSTLDTMTLTPQTN
ncbi:MAG TPA: hypothetical protein VGQ59_06965 [Cyclobacteriaceae bacterium]|jgi:hypothetical protein|nr:hypothetical protein [Cyclobacteriaceae bacterium]